MSVDYKAKVVLGYQISEEEAEAFNEQTNWMYESYIHRADYYENDSDIILGVEMNCVNAGCVKPLYSNETDASAGTEEEYEALRYISEFMRKIDPDARIRTYIMCQAD